MPNKKPCSKLMPKLKMTLLGWFTASHYRKMVICFFICLLKTGVRRKNSSLFGLCLAYGLCLKVSFVVGERIKDTPMAGSEDQQASKEEDGFLTKIKKAIFG
jgi:hypothetical protein